MTNYPPPPLPPKRAWWRSKAALWAVVALVVFGSIGAAVGDNGKKHPAATDTAPAVAAMTPVATSTPSADSSADAARRAAARLAAARKATAARKAAARAAAARAVARQRAKRQAALRAAAARRAAAVRAEAARRKAAVRRRAAASAANCTPGYSPCVPVASDVDCAGGSGDGPVYVEGPIRVTGDDPYDLDRDGDGIACEDG